MPLCLKRSPDGGPDPALLTATPPRRPSTFWTNTTQRKHGANAYYGQHKQEG